MIEKNQFLSARRALALSFLLCAGSSFARQPEPKGPNHDLTQEIDFERLSTYPLGPTGAHGWMYVKKSMTVESRQILITKVEAGSPADGILQDGDVILGINGKRFDSDARRAFGWAIVEAEKNKNKGELRLTRWRPIADAATRQGTETEVTIQLEVYGSFSDTAPYACPRSELLMDTALERVTAQAVQKKFGRLGESLLALMAVGRPPHMKMVRDHLHEARWASPDFKINIAIGSKISWGAGMHGLIMAEYYLATGDKYVLPALRETATKIAMGQSGGGLWGHGFAWTSKNNGELHGSLQGYGALNLAGLPCLLTMVLAEKCGIHHPEIDAAIDRALPFFANFVGHGTVGYGYHRPSLDHYNNGRNGFSSNGKNAIAGIILTLTGDRKASNYYSKLVTSSYEEREYGHAGNSFNRFWGMMGANCGGPQAVAAFYNELHWYSALCRGWDGRIMTQRLGGYYGGKNATLNLEAGQVLGNALPLRKLYITGKNPNKKFWLSDAQVDDAIAAGRWHWADYNNISTARLIEELDCWSPGAREWMAVELGRREGVVPLLLKAMSSKRAELRAGACAALGYQGERAAAAVPALVKALSDTKAPVRVAASYGIMRIGEPGRKAIPDMLAAVVAPDQEGPLQPTLQALSYSLGADAMNTAPLYFIGILPQTPDGENPLDGIDRDVLYPAFARLARDRSARIRDCGTFMLRYFSRDDVKAMAQEIYDLIRKPAPDFGMFAGRARGHGIDVMARYQIADGAQLTVDAIASQGWGWFMISPHHFLTLQTYGSTASEQLPWLKEKRLKWHSGENRETLEATIKAIETDQQKHQTITLVDLVGERVDEELKTARNQKARIKICRRLIRTKPQDYLQHAAALRRLVAMLKTNSANDVLFALGRSSDLLRREAVELGSGLSRVDWQAELKKATSHRQAAGILNILAKSRARKALNDVKRYLDSEDQERHIAAIDGVGVLGDEAEISGLISRLEKTADGNEQTALERAIATLAANDVQGLLTEWPKTIPGAQVSLARILGAIGNAQALDALIELASNNDRRIRNAAFDLLATSSRAALTKRLLAIGDAMKDQRRKAELAELCLKRLVVGHVPETEAFAVLTTAISLANNNRSTTRALQQLRWMPSAEALRLTREWMKKTPANKADRAVIEAAARAAVDIAQALAESAAKHTALATEAVKDALKVAQETTTITDAEAFLK